MDTLTRPARKPQHPPFLGGEWCYTDPNAHTLSSVPRYQKKREKRSCDIRVLATPTSVIGKVANLLSYPPIRSFLQKEIVSSRVLSEQFTDPFLQYVGLLLLIVLCRQSFVSFITPLLSDNKRSYFSFLLPAHAIIMFQFRLRSTFYN